MTPALEVTEPTDELDHVILRGWLMSQQLMPGNLHGYRPAEEVVTQQNVVRATVARMWQLRAFLRMTGANRDEEGSQGLKTLHGPQATARKLRQEC